MSQHQSSVSLFIVFSATAVFMAGWLGWNSLKTIDLGEQAAAVLQWQQNNDKKLTDYQDKLDNLGNDVADLKGDMRFTKELLSLISERYQIDPVAVEARVLRETKQREGAPSTTAVAI